MWKEQKQVGKHSERVVPPYPRIDEESNTPETVQEHAKSLKEQINRLALHMERANFSEYVQLMNRPRRLIYLSFLGGLARGVGVGVGFTIIGATLLYFLQKLTLLNLPIIGDYIADIVRIVQAQMNTPTY
jgi:hypothetical protein